MNCKVAGNEKVPETFKSESRQGMHKNINTLILNLDDIALQSKTVFQN